MAWTWSHTAEAYGHARANLEALPAETLEAIAAEWTAAAPYLCLETGDGSRDPCGFADRSATRAQDHQDETGHRLQSPSHAPPVPADPGAIWDLMAAEETGYRCDNGGWDAWACPEGCHTVPFSPPSETGPGTPYARHGRGVPAPARVRDLWRRRLHRGNRLRRLRPAV